MDILPEIEKRRAFRAIAPDALPEEQIERLLRAATLAPSCSNNQPWRLVAVRGETLERLREALTQGNRWATRAPLIVLLATKPSLDCRLDMGRDYAYFGLGLAAMALMLQATREGLYAHPIAGYNAAKAAAAVGLPEDFVALNLIIVGKPGDQELLSESQRAQEDGPRQRRPLEEVAFDGRWGQPWPGQPWSERP